MKVRMVEVREGEFLGPKAITLKGRGSKWSSSNSTFPIARHRISCSSFSMLSRTPRSRTCSAPGGAEGELRNAKWDERPASTATGRQAWSGYKVRNRGGRSVYSLDGFCWFDSWGKSEPRPSESIRFHGGPLDGQVVKSVHPTGG